VSSPVPYLDPVQLQRDLGLRDLSEPAEGPHAIQILISQPVERLAGVWKCEVRWCRGPRIVPVADNYDRLGYPAEAITRETRYTRYVDAGTMLRSHSSAMIPRRCAASPASPATTCCWSARASCTAETPSTGSTPEPRTSSTCGGSPGTR
jgi:phenylalanyl-tRNA synthetase alpha chain